MGFSGLRALLLVLYMAAVLVTGKENKRPLVETQYGSLQGITVPVKETPRTVDVFLGIPFAKAPVGSLRFARPQGPESWGSVRDASKYPPMCLQDKDVLERYSKIYKTPFELPPISEDCLYLNVYTPNDRAQGAALPVMTFIHGGGLLVGTASMHDGSALSAHEDVVVVSIQYRLGILGFFSTRDGQVQGNLGLMDQVAALQWVKGNIANFGGDPNSVTIFGESAGGISVSALMLSPLSNGLFHRAISQSGVTAMPTLVVSKPEELIPYRNMVAELLGCEPAKVADCIRKKSEEEFVSVAKKMGFLPLPVCVDGGFLPKSVQELWASKKNNKIPYIIGMNDQEFGWIMPQLLEMSTDGLDRASAESTLRSIPILGISPSAVPHILDEYFGDTNDPHELRERLLDICGDALFVMPGIKVANHQRDSGHPVYLYEYQHRPSMFHDIKPDYVKADHMDELIFVFGGPFLRNGVIFSGDATDEEKALSKTIMKYWANFARKGDPNGPGLEQWPLYGSDEHYLKINLKQKSSKRLKEDKYKFWKEKIWTHPGEREDRTEL